MTAFLVVGVVGLVLLAASLLLGDVLDGALDALAGDVFSTAVIGGFVSAFGFGAATADGLGTPLPLTLVVGVVAGVLVGWFASRLTGLVRHGGTDDVPAAEDALGRGGTVVTAVPDDGFGVVRVLIGGHVVRLNARAAAALPAGTEIHVTEILSPTAVAVAPVHGELTDPHA